MRRLFTVLLAVLLLSCSATHAQRLVIVHLNDTHSHLDPERSGPDKGLGGVVERAAYLDSLRNAVGRDRVLLLHGGDWDQGTPYFTRLEGNLEISLIDALGYDCLTLGNHEFDNGIEDLTRRLRNVKAKVVCANYDFSPFELGRYVKPYAVVRRGGMKIGIIGMLTDISSVVSRATADRIPRIEDEVATINGWASFLKGKKHCDMVIVLSHMGYSEDVDAAAGLHDVDIIIGGHSHTYLNDFTYVDDADGKALPVIQDGQWGRTIGRIDVY